MKAATDSGWADLLYRRISIHAAREGGDGLTATVSLKAGISIHAAREGGDRCRHNGYKKAPAISIHAAREGGDHSKFASSPVTSVFQSTPPVKAATQNNSEDYGGRKYFNPRRP